MPQKKISKKEADYKERIINALGNSAYSRNELAIVMGYKGISAKLSATIDKMIQDAELENIIVGTRVKIRVRK